MTNEEARWILKFHRPDRPRSTDRRQLQKAIDVILDESEHEERPVHCKDCKHTVLSENGKTLICCLTMKVGTVRPDFYCGNGERELHGGSEV